MCVFVNKALNNLFINKKKNFNENFLERLLIGDFGSLSEYIFERGLKIRFSF
jgi:hypothetical protein